jgi:hypothetical protein
MEGTPILQRREVAVVNARAVHLHALDGRLRIKITALKGSPQKAQEIERRFQTCEGITQVTANPVTGSVLILYDSQQIKQGEILDMLKSQGCLPENGTARAVAKNVVETQPGFGHELVQTVVLSTMEFALQRLVYTLI